MGEMLVDLLDQQRQLQDELSKVGIAIYNARLLEAKDKYGVEIGGIVSCRGKEYRVVEIDTSWGRPWLTGNPRLKDGTFGKANRNLFSDWEVVSAPEEVKPQTRENNDGN